MKRIFGALVLLSTLCVGSVQAQYTLKLPADLEGPSGSSLTMPVLLDNAGLPLGGWSYGVCHNAAEVTPTDAINGSTTNTVQNGSPAAFVNIAIDSVGVSVGLVISLMGTATLPIGTDFELMLIDYDLIAPNGTTTLLDFCNDAGNPPVQTVVVEDGQAIIPTQIGTSIEIDIVPFVLEFGVTAAVEQGGSIDVPMILSNSQPVYGYSFGVENDPGALAVAAVNPGADLLGLNGGLGPDFFQSTLSPTGGSGFTVGCVFTVGSTVETLAPGGPYEITMATYDVLGGAPLGDTLLNFVDTLSPPAPAPPVALRISIGEDSVTPVISPGIVTIEQGGTTFVRGDLNANPGIDLSDPINLLDYLFSGGMDPTCFDAADFDDSGVLDIGDAINLLNFLFAGGAMPSAPHPACGSDPSGDADGLTCLMTASCP